MQDIVTFKEHIHDYLITVPRDRIRPLRVQMEDQRYSQYHNDCYFRFECQECEKNWTSGMGHCYIPFYIMGDNFRNNKLIVPKEQVKDITQNVTIEYDFYFMRQKCKNCKDWGQQELPRYEKGRIADNFAMFIDKVLKGEIEPLPKNKKNKKKMAKNHRIDLCEACSLGKCREKRIEIPKGQNQGNQINGGDNNNNRGNNGNNDNNRNNANNIINGNNRNNINNANQRNQQNQHNQRNQRDQRNQVNERNQRIRGRRRQ